MQSAEIPALEPFSEVLSPTGARWSGEVVRLGYRIAGTDTVLTSIEVPLAVVRESIPRELAINLDPRGLVTASVECYTKETEFRAVSLVDLVRQLLHADRIRMEEIGMSDLEALLHILKISMQLVEAKMA
ncbi:MULTISPECIES: hypothetical protein [Bradyrhizobium]|jgi:hypothetical protein|uniref:Uncharacterized protein n=1 Tax=Bradyrhizobium elkanii TaxID=29448 RepID=A0A8I1YBF9_BRAEL|nr:MULTISPECIES: hypothetical protein [Bradyrhizobium]MBP1295740.1 hypothetical protein [Bradyrhizobium elkanii]MCA1402202.1 hypothetical protein [Bradyrhizobium sp. BRP56]MCP1933360.1 hypothetical protein [Bradyrhizobium elkanii]MCS3478630.1 hypothetical protein [Bradyrhizobium elkanii]MCS3585402.1 hypothetical protein [Bradyrhizobium elkanii]